MGEDSKEFLLTPIEGLNYVRIEDDVIDNFADVTEDEELVTDSNTITKVESHTAIKANEVIEIEANTSDEGDTDVENSLETSDAFISGVAIIHD